MLMGGANEVMDMKIFYHPQSDKPLEYYYYKCAGGWSRKCLQLGKVEPDVVAPGPLHWAPLPSPLLLVISRS